MGSTSEPAGPRIRPTRRAIAAARLRARTAPAGGHALGLALAIALALVAVPCPAVAQTSAARPMQPPDPAARLLAGESASEYWTLFVELDSGHRITQRFLITNAGPGDHSAVAVGHLIERGRTPYRYQNGRRRNAWTLSADKLYLDIAASHLDLHRPKGALKITKDELEILLDFDFDPDTVGARVPSSALPKRYSVDVLAVATPTRGRLRAPWMKQPIPVKGHLWLVHTWTPDDEATRLNRRIDVYGRGPAGRFYGLEISDGPRFEGGWQLFSPVAPAAGVSPRSPGSKVDSPIHFAGRWQDGTTLLSAGAAAGYPVPDRFAFQEGTHSGDIHLRREWLRFDPLEVIPQPFRWFIRRSSHPQEVWADSRIAVSIGRALDRPPTPPTSGSRSDSNTKRETEDEATEKSVSGVASVTFMNPIDRR